MDLNSEQGTDFLEYLKFVWLKKGMFPHLTDSLAVLKSNQDTILGNEASVDDMMCEFLKRVMPPKFLIK